jgi:ubiquinone/menaquinone biosynthesis C-methylase UbiE
MMRLTRPERWVMNSRSHARRTVRVAQGLLERFSLPAEPLCLEVGCGQGALARLLAEQYNARVIATDFDPAQVALAKKRLTGMAVRVEFRVMDARAMVFDDGRFDAVFSFGVLHHITRGWQKAVSEVARVLRPGGWYAFTEMVVPLKAGGLRRRLLLAVGLLGEAELRSSLSANGLEVDHFARERATAGLAAYSMGTAQKMVDGL